MSSTLRFHDAPCEAINQLIQTIKPSKESVERRYGVQEYVRKTIARCFAPEQVNAYMFGSVPLRTYLPDGDIDLSVFCAQEAAQSMRDTWALKLQAVIEQEQAAGSAPFRIGDVTVINAEVKLLKCLVDNIVVDISFNQMGGLVTLNFLEETNSLIGNSNIFKRSIILVKAWCYYESRLLGAHHGLISTYALETLVLYVFNKYHGSIDSPLTVLYNFLLEFSSFDWDHYCLSLLGPVPLKDLPSAHVDSDLAPQDTLLQCDSRLADSLAHFRAEMASSRADMGGKAFVVRCLNIMDPLLPNNNLGRSVVRSSFARIRRAFGHGATLLRAVASKEPGAAVQELERLFRNTWAALQKHNTAVAAPPAQQQQQQGVLAPMQVTARLPKHAQLQLQQPMQHFQQQRQQQPEGKELQQPLAPLQTQPAENGVQQQPPQQHSDLEQQQLLARSAAQHHQALLLQHSLGQLLLEACSDAGVSLEVFLASPREQQVAVLLKHLQLSLSTSTGVAGLAPGQRQQQQQQLHQQLLVSTFIEQQQRQQQQLQQQQAQQQQPPGLIESGTAPGRLLAEPAAATARQHSEAAAVPNCPRSPSKRRADELIALEAAAAAAAERAMANLGLPKGAMLNKGQQQKPASSVMEAAAGPQQQQLQPTSSAAGQAPHNPEPAVTAVTEEEQQQPAPAEVDLAQPPVAAAEQELEQLLQQPELLAAAGAVDFSRVKAAVLAAGVNRVPPALADCLAGQQDTALQSPQQMPSSAAEVITQSQQRVDQPFHQGQIILLRDVLQLADRLAQSSAAQQQHLVLHHHQLSLVQRSSSVPPVLSASSAEALAAVPDAAGPVSTVGSLDVPTTQQQQQQQAPAARGLERSASTGNLQRVREQPQASAQVAAAAAALAMVKKQAAAAAYASQALVSPLSAYSFSGHAVNIAAAAAAATTVDAQHSQAGLLQQLQQQQYQLILQQQEQLVQQQQQQVDVLEGNLEQLTYNLQMAKAYMLNSPLPSKQPLQRQQPFAPHIPAGAAVMASAAVLAGAGAGSIMAADVPLQGQQHAAVGHARLQMEQQLRMLAQMGATANGVAVPATQGAVAQQSLVDQQQQQQPLLQQQQQQLANMQDRPGSAGSVQPGLPAPASRSSAAAAEAAALQAEPSQAEPSVIPQQAELQDQLTATQPCTQPCTQQQEVLADVAESAFAPDLAPAAADEVKPAAPSIAKYTPPHRRTSQGNAAAAPVTGTHRAGASAPDESKQGGGAAAHNSSAPAADGSCDCEELDQQQQQEPVPAALSPDAAVADTSTDSAAAVTEDESSTAAVAGVPYHMAPIKTGSLCDSSTPPMGPVGSTAVATGAAFTGRATAAGQEACMSVPSTTTASPALLALSGRAATPKTPLSAKAAPFVSRFAAPLSSAGTGVAAAAASLAASRASDASERPAAAPVAMQSRGGAAVEAAPAGAAEAAADLEQSSEQQQQQLQQPPAVHAQVLAVRQQQLSAADSSGSLVHSPLVSISSYDTAESTHFESTPGTPGSPVEQQNSQGAVASEESFNFAGGKPALGSSSEPSSGRSSRASTSAPAASAAGSVDACATGANQKVAASTEGLETSGGLEVFASVEAELEGPGGESLHQPNSLPQASELDSSQATSTAEGLQQEQQQQLATAQAAVAEACAPAAISGTGFAVSGGGPASGTAGEACAAVAAVAAPLPAGRFSSAGGSEHTTDSNDSIGRSCTYTDEFIESKLGLEMELTDDIYTPSTRSLHSYDDEAAMEHTDDAIRQPATECAYSAGNQRQQQQQQQQPRGMVRGSRSSSSGHQQHHPLPPPPPPPPKHEQLQQQQQTQQFLEQQPVQLAWLPLEPSSALGGSGPHIFVEPTAALGGSGHLLLEPTAALGGSGPMLANSVPVPGVQGQQQQQEQPAAAARCYGSQLPKKPKLSTSSTVSSSSAEISGAGRPALGAAAAGPIVSGHQAQVLYGPTSGFVPMGAGAMRVPGLVAPVLVPFNAAAGVAQPASPSPVAARQQLLNAASGGGAGPKGEGTAQTVAAAAAGALIQGLNAVGDAAGGASKRRSFSSGVPATSTAPSSFTTSSMKIDRQPHALPAAGPTSSLRPGDTVGAAQQSGNTAHAGAAAGAVVASGAPSPRSLSGASSAAGPAGLGAAVKAQTERISAAMEQQHQQQMAGGLSRQHSTQASSSGTMDQHYAVSALTAAVPSDASAVRNHSTAEGARLPAPPALTPAAVQHAAVMQVASLQAAAAMGMMPQDVAAKQIAAALQAHQAAAAGQLVRPSWLDGAPAVPMFLGMTHSTPAPQQQQQEGQGSSRAEDHSAAPPSSSATAAGKVHPASVGPYVAAGGRSGSSAHNDRGSSSGTPTPGQPGTVQSPRAAAATSSAAAAAAAAGGSGAMPIASSPYPQLPPMLATMLNPLSSSLGAFSPVAFPGPAAFMSHPGLMGPLMFPMVPAAFAAAPPMHPAGITRTGSAGGATAAAAAGASLQRGGSGRHISSNVSMMGHTDTAGQQEPGRPGSQVGQPGGTAAQGHSRQSSLGGQPPRDQQQQQYKDMQQHFARDQQQQQQQRMEQQMREHHQQQQADYQQQQYRIDQQHYNQRQYGQQQYREQQHRSEHYREQQQQQLGSVRHHPSAAYHSCNDGHPPPGFVSRRGQQQQLQQLLSSANEGSSTGGVHYSSSTNSRRTSQGSEAGYLTVHHQQQHQQQLPSGAYRLQHHPAAAAPSSAAATAAAVAAHHHAPDDAGSAVLSGASPSVTAADLATSAVKRAAAHSPTTASKLTPGTGVYVPGAATLAPEQQQLLAPEQQQQAGYADRYLQQQQQGLPPSRGSGVARSRGLQQQQQQQHPQQTLADVQPGRSTTGGNSSGAFASVQHYQRDNSTEEDPVTSVHRHHAGQAVEQQQQPKGSRIVYTDGSAAAGGLIDSFGVPAASTAQQQEQPAVEYSSSTVGEPSESALAFQRGIAAAVGRPRVPVATVVSLVQATQEDRERQSKQKERRMAAAASMARTHTDHQQQQQQLHEAVTTAQQQDEAAEHIVQQHNTSHAQEHKQQHQQHCEDAGSSPVDILHALPLHMSRLRSAGAASSSMYSLTSSNCSSGTGTPRAGGSGGGEAASAASAAGGVEGSERRRSRSVGVTSGLSRLFTQAVHRAVEHRAAEDLQQSPMHAALGGSGASAGSGGGSSSGDVVQQQQLQQQPSTQQQATQQQQQQQQQQHMQPQQQQQLGQLHHPMRLVSESGGGAGSSRAAGSSSGSVSGSSGGGKRGAAALSSRSPDERLGHGVGDGPQQQQRSGPALAAAAAIAAALAGGGAGRRVIGRKASRDDLAQQHQQQGFGVAAARDRSHQQQQGGGSQQQATLQQQSALMSSKPNKAGSIRGPTHSRQDTAGSGLSPMYSDQEHHQEQRGSRPSAVSVSPPLDDVNMFPSLPTSNAASPAATNKGWVAPRPNGGSSASSSRRASADGAVAGSSTKHSRGDAVQLGTASGSILQESMVKEPQLSRGRVSHRSDSSTSLHGLAQSSSQQEFPSSGGAGRSSSSTRHQRGTSQADRKANQEFQLADEDFPALGAAAAAAGKGSAGGISRKGSSGRLDTS